MRLRAPVPADAPAVLAVLEARDCADLGESDRTLEDLLDEWQGSDLDLELSARVIEIDGGRIAAYAAIRRPGTLAVVAPGDEGRGIGSRARVDRNARPRAPDATCIANGWPVRTPLHGRCLPAPATSGPAATGGWCARSKTSPRRPIARPASPSAVDAVQDVVGIHAVDAASFATTPDYVPESLTEFIEEHLEAHDFDAGLSRVVTEAAVIVGFLLAGRRPEEASDGFTSWPSIPATRIAGSGPRCR